ncbi:DUF6586 family protein [Gilvimarinus sp. DA14]|uniref:DUF6586 family protein n=1 Tax=Gilvimarinus sp. DA14 TaxID=2956798 RepID=UPI0020B76F0E|nr:DUF6586 family protein [Gilvimarinus sp. DA14]UTF60944.1 hypothetical protein NHM04_03855 [Gilvimarinus sp. DA14]
MAVSLVSLVNQRLACCRALLQDAPSSRNQVHHKALIDACLFHLMCGYHHYVRELSNTYGVKNLAALEDEATAIQALSQQGKTSAELQELSNLVTSKGSWLYELKGHYQAVWALPEKEQEPGMIPLANLDAPQLGELTLDSLACLCSEFQALIERQRDNSLEC